jgi:hypothetical protein
VLKYDDVMARVLQLPQYANWDRGDFMLQVFVNSFSLSGGGGTASNQAMTFPPGAVILGMTAGASPTAAATAATLERPGLELFTIGLNYQQQFTLIGQSQALAVSVFGQYNDLFPAKEIIIPNNGSLLVSLTNLASDAITVWLTSHCLVPSQIQ